MSILDKIKGTDDYLRAFGKMLGAKAARALSPMHVPGVTPLPSFDDIEKWNANRLPFWAQAHVIAACRRMMDAYGGGFIVGEMGTGKTIVSILAVHKHAQARARPGETAAYRTVVVCPDHLCAKWEQEILTTIPHAKVTRCKSTWARELYATTQDHKSGTTGKNGLKHWRKPQGPEWVILGRNQIKWAPSKSSTTTPMTGYGCRPTGKLNLGRAIVSQELKLDKEGRITHKPDGRPERKWVTVETLKCPRCGKPARDKKGSILGPGDIKNQALSCGNWFLKEIPPDDGTRFHRCERIYHGDPNSAVSEVDSVLFKALGEAKVGKTITIDNRKFMVEECGEPLWQWSRKPYRWPAARFIKKNLKRLFSYALIDEVHELKGGSDVAQANACGAILASARWKLCLTGTLIGGYATDIFNLACRLGWRSIFDEGFKFGKEMDFAKVYGIVDEIHSTTLEEAPTKSIRSVSMKNDAKVSKRFREAPGIMPSLYGRHMVGRAVFLTLEEMADGLPHFIEYVANCPDIQTDSVEYDALYRHHYFPVSVEMDDDLANEYRRVAGKLEAAARDLLMAGSKKLLGTLLATTLQYPDRPFDWGPDHRLKAAISLGRQDGLQIDDGDVLPVGYWVEPGKYNLHNWVGVVKPKDLDRDMVRPKEQAIIDICKHHKAHGNQVWVYVQMTDKRDIRGRLADQLRANGLTVGILKSDTVKVQERGDWINKNGSKFDVMISYPKLVSTGLDLFGKEDGAHNFNVLVFYQTGYSVFDLRQASRRAWRLSQPKTCFVYYLSYRGTMQQRAMQLMARKTAAALALDGVFSSEGLAGMAGGDGAMAMVRELSGAMDDADMQRSWGKATSGGGGKIRRVATTNAESDPNVIDVEFADDVAPDLTPPPKPTTETIETRRQRLLAEIDEEWEAEWLAMMESPPETAKGENSKP